MSKKHECLGNCGKVLTDGSRLCETCQRRINQIPAPIMAALRRAGQGRRVIRKELGAQ